MRITELSIRAWPKFPKILYAHRQPILDISLRNLMKSKLLVQNGPQSLGGTDLDHPPSPILGFNDYIVGFQRREVWSPSGGILLLGLRHLKGLICLWTRIKLDHLQDRIKVTFGVARVVACFALIT